jgi:hypothetical protein
MAQKLPNKPLNSKRPPQESIDRFNSYLEIDFSRRLINIFFSTKDMVTGSGNKN